MLSRKQNLLSQTCQFASYSYGRFLQKEFVIVRSLGLKTHLVNLVCKLKLEYNKQNEINKTKPNETQNKMKNKI